MAYDPGAAVRRYMLLPDFHLENGLSICDFQLSYIVHGEPDADGGNVVLVTSSLGGDAHRLDFMIGDGLPFDPACMCIIAVDSIGNGHSSSPSNSINQARMRFPPFAIRDMVAAQRRLLKDVFGLDRILAVAGASMGGMQALQWAVSYPGVISGIVALVPMARSAPWSILVNEVSRRIVMADPAWNGGEYSTRDFAGWRASLAYVQAIISRSPSSVGDDIGDDDAIKWIDQLIDRSLPTAFDPNDWIFQSRAFDAHDLGTTPGFGGDTQAALKSISVPGLIMGPDFDLLTPPEDQRFAAGFPAARYVAIPSSRGHLAANVGSAADIALINAEAATFLSSLRSSPD